VNVIIHYPVREEKGYPFLFSEGLSM
jgi:hypothetical protein